MVFLNYIFKYSKTLTVYKNIEGIPGIHSIPSDVHTLIHSLIIITYVQQFIFCMDTLLHARQACESDTTVVSLYENKSFEDNI